MRTKLFVKRDEGFVCENCGKEIERLSYSSRNHCPFCLFSKHLDNNPGDRNNDCAGIMKPIAVIPYRDKGFIITHKCEKCGFIRKNRSQVDDDTDLLIKYTNPFNVKEAAAEKHDG